MFRRSRPVRGKSRLHIILLGIVALVASSMIYLEGSYVIIQDPNWQQPQSQPQHGNQKVVVSPQAFWERKHQKSQQTSIQLFVEQKEVKNLQNATPRNESTPQKDPQKDQRVPNNSKPGSTGNQKLQNRNTTLQSFLSMEVKKALQNITVQLTTMNTTSTALSTHPATTTARRPKMPNLLIAGVQKGGTTILFEHLLTTPWFCRPHAVVKAESSYVKKEVHFFDIDQRYNKGLAFYQAHFVNCKNLNNATAPTARYVVDATPNYFAVPERIHQAYQQETTTGEEEEGRPPSLLSGLRIIFSLRDPVMREFSWYNHMKRLKRWQYVVQHPEKKEGAFLTFDEYVDRVLLLPYNNNTDSRSGVVAPTTFGMYGPILRRWLDLFDRQSILILSFEESQSDPAHYLQRVHSFLKIPVLPPPTTTTTTTTTTGGGQQHTSSLSFGTRTFSAKSLGQTDTPSCEAYHKLWKVFESSNQKLYDLLEKNPGPTMEQRPFPRFSSPCL